MQITFLFLQVNHQFDSSGGQSLAPSHRKYVKASQQNLVYDVGPPQLTFGIDAGQLYSVGNQKVFLAN